MRILYAIQGTGNGHLTRARDVYPELKKYSEVDVLISGIQADVDVPFPVKYRLYGLSFIFGKHGGVDIWATVKNMKLLRLMRDIMKLPVHKYDLIINDFEPVSAWACKLGKKPCISLSHQSAVLHPDAPKPAHSDWMGTSVLKHYAPAAKSYGFHFTSFAKNIFTPVIRKEVRQLQISEEGHYTVYLPAYSDEELVKHLSVFPEVRWEVFSKHNREAFAFKNIHVRPIENSAFIQSMATSNGVLSGAGFETPTEALYLGKKLLVVPMSGQYEQQCNAAMMASMGIPVIRSLDKKHYPVIRKWLAEEATVNVHYPDNIRQVITRVMEDYLSEQTFASRQKLVF